MAKELQGLHTLPAPGLVPRESDVLSSFYIDSVQTQKDSSVPSDGNEAARIKKKSGEVQRPLFPLWTWQKTEGRR